MAGLNFYFSSFATILHCVNRYIFYTIIFCVILRHDHVIFSGEVRQSAASWASICRPLSSSRKLPFFTSSTFFLLTTFFPPPGSFLLPPIIFFVRRPSLNWTKICQFFQQIFKMPPSTPHPPLAGSAGPVVTPLCRSCLFNDDMSASSFSIRPQHPVCLLAKARKLSSHSLPRDDLAQHLTRPDLMSNFLC